MSKNVISNLGIMGWDTYEYIVNDLERSKHFYCSQLGLPLIAQLNERHRNEHGEKGYLFKANAISISCVSPQLTNSRTDRWLKRHPDGVSILGLKVRDLELARQKLKERGATFWTEIVESQDYQNKPYRYFEIATPLGDVRYRFVERSVDTLLPGFEPIEEGKDIENPFKFQSIDHVTSNFLTIEPYISWLRDVMGFEEYWRINFHTSDIKGQDGSGLFSIVMQDPESKIKMANNEPLIPNFEGSQIYTFIEDNCGPGVQHIAYHVPNIEPTVQGLEQNGIDFLNVPGTYYEMLPSRLENRKVSNFKENIEQLEKLGILVDGQDDKYLLQIFMQESALLYDEKQAGPFFYEVIQRKGARGFGEGNFRALFESIERDQHGRDSKQYGLVDS